MSITYRCCQHCPESLHGLHLVPCIICAADVQRDDSSAAAEVYGGLRDEVKRLTDLFRSVDAALMSVAEEGLSYADFVDTVADLTTDALRGAR